MDILYVEDENRIRSNYEKKFSDFGSVTTSGELNDALNLLNRKKFDAIFVDLNLSKNDSLLEGIEIIKKASGNCKFIAALSSVEEKRIVQRALNNGANKFYVKRKLKNELKKGIKDELNKVKSDLQDNFFKVNYVTSNIELIQNVKAACSVFSTNTSNLLITGKTGVGKSTLAKEIHLKAGGSLDNWVHVNVATLPKELVDSILFGYVKGSHNTANSDKDGLVKAAEGGTLFLDEIESLDLSLQSKLLTLLQEGIYYRLGDNSPMKANFRLITATQYDPKALIKRNLLREDLYWRIKGFHFDIPQLADRRYDIGLLINLFIEKFDEEYGTKTIFSDDAISFMVNEYPWPGNVRELEKEISFICQNSNGVVTKNHLSDELIKNKNIKDDNSLLTEEMWEIIGQLGLPGLIQKIENEIVSETQVRFPVESKAFKYLQISNTKYKKIINNINKEIN